MFITDAKMNLTKAEESGEPARFTAEELAALEKTLKEHEVWLNEVVEKGIKALMAEKDTQSESPRKRRHGRTL